MQRVHTWSPVWLSVHHTGQTSTSLAFCSTTASTLKHVQWCTTARCHTQAKQWQTDRSSVLPGLLAPIVGSRFPFLASVGSCARGIRSPLMCRWHRFTSSHKLAGRAFQCASFRFWKEKSHVILPYKHCAGSVSAASTTWHSLSVDSLDHGTITLHTPCTRCTCAQL